MIESNRMPYSDFSSVFVPCNIYCQCIMFIEERFDKLNYIIPCFS